MYQVTSGYSRFSGVFHGTAGDCSRQAWWSHTWCELVSDVQKNQSKLIISPPIRGWQTENGEHQPVRAVEANTRELHQGSEILIDIYLCNSVIPFSCVALKKEENSKGVILKEWIRYLFRPRNIFYSVLLVFNLILQNSISKRLWFSEKWPSTKLFYFTKLWHGIYEWQFLDREINLEEVDGGPFP